MDRTEENRQEYKELQRRVKREVSKAKQKAYDELYTRRRDTEIDGRLILMKNNHVTSNTPTALERFQLFSTQLVKTQTDVQQMIQDRLKKIKEIKHSVDQSKRSTEKEKADSVEVFTALIRSIERSQAELLEVIEEKQKAAERQAEGLIKELEQEITVLKRRDTELEQISHTEEHLHLLQIYSSMCSPPHTKNWTEISINTDLSGDTVRTALSQLQQTLNEKLTKTLNDRLKATVSTELKRIQQYAVDVTLDPDTAHPKLILSADGKQVTHGHTRQNLPDTPQMFNTYVNVLGKQSFSSGRFYYEVQVRGKTEWSVGVVKKSINRKGKLKLTPQNGFWTVYLWNESQYWALAGPSVPLTLREKAEVVGVFVDYEEGLVSFYNVKSRSHIYSFTGPGRLAVINGTMNSAVHQKILEENVRPSVYDLKLKRTWVLQQDNDPKHTSKSTSEWLKKNKMKTLE
ncbi:hypothetical protein QTP86_029114 [Hemibagrus guttatus]|nr:hypothetical protein QTP86_029114 [Hemibagrus guttatus]